MATAMSQLCQYPDIGIVVSFIWQIMAQFSLVIKCHINATNLQSCVNTKSGVFVY